MLFAYRLISKASGPLLSHLLAKRLEKAKEHPERITERKGIASHPRPEGRLAWLHAASVGEAVSSLMLIQRLLDNDPSLTVLLTSGTVTSAKIVANRLPDRAIHQFVPLDHPTWVDRFLDHWSPDVAIWLESELWPNLILGAKRRGIPMVLANARLSLESFRRWRRLSGAARQLMASFSVILPQTADDAEKYKALGAQDVRCLGNLKLAAAPLKADDKAVAELREAIGKRPVWLAASTHAGEEAIVAQAHEALCAQYPNLLTIIVPRHPERLDDVLADVAPHAGKIAVRSRGEAITGETDLYIGDTLGELGLFYTVSPISLVCGSLVDKIGGHNPIEPAQLGSAILFGRHMANFREVERDMLAAEAAIHVKDEAGLIDEVDRLLASRQRREEAARKALYYARQGERILEEVTDVITAQLGPGEARS